MRIAIATVQVPFIAGGAELQTRGLHDALVEAGHRVEVVTMPFRFSPCDAVRRAMDGWSGQDFDHLEGGPIDRVIALRFPAIYLKHEHKIVWLMHQHRSVYELLGTPHGEDPGNADVAELRCDILARDTAALRSARAVFTTSQEVSGRLLRFNGIESSPILHPPGRTHLLRSDRAYPYIFFPSRLETLKRQELLVRAMALVAPPMVALLAGDGGQDEQLKHLAAELGLNDRVRFLGRIDDETLASYYSHARAVFFGPYLEDYGYITLEAMLSSRPVITCSDSGGPTQFVQHGITGLVTEPTPQAIAAAINELQADPVRAERMGRQGRELYDALDITWHNVVRTLLEA